MATGHAPPSAIVSRDGPHPVAPLDTRRESKGTTRNWMASQDGPDQTTELKERPTSRQKWTMSQLRKIAVKQSLNAITSIVNIVYLAYSWAISTPTISYNEFVNCVDRNRSFLHRNRRSRKWIWDQPSHQCFWHNFTIETRAYASHGKKSKCKGAWLCNG